MLSVLGNSANHHQEHKLSYPSETFKTVLIYALQTCTQSYKRLPTDSVLVSAYEHIVAQKKKQNTNMIYLNVAMKSIVNSLGNNTYNFV